MRLAEPARQQIADSCFKSDLNFQKRTREPSIEKETIDKINIIAVCEICRKHEHYSFEEIKRLHI